MRRLSTGNACSGGGYGLWAHFGVCKRILGRTLFSTSGSPKTPMQSFSLQKLSSSLSLSQTHTLHTQKKRRVMIMELKMKNFSAQH
jgi:hypothetical protein